MNAHWFHGCKEQLATWSHIAFPNRKNAGTSAPQVSALEARILFDANPSFGDTQGLASLDLSLDVESLFQPADLPLDFSNSIQVDESLDVDLQEFSNPPLPLDDLSITAEAEILTVSREIVVIDASIDDYQAILDGIGKQSGMARDFTVLITRPHQDGIGEITALLNQLEDVKAIHIISHARDGEVFLGNSVLNLDSLADRAGEFAIWRTHLSLNADILIYGCDLAASDAGETLVDQLSGLIEADIAASDDLTGHESLSGDWELEYQAGLINTSSLASSHLFDPWFGLLATTTSTVTTGNQETTDDNGGSQHAIAMDASGNFVVVWSSNDNAVGHDTDGYGVYAQRYDRFGAKVGTEIVVNNQRAFDQNQASVAMDDAGNFVVVWADHTTTGPGSAIKVMAKRYDANGNSIMSDTQITSGSNDSINPSVAMSSFGEYVIAWQRASTSQDVYAALYDTNGTTLATSFRVHGASPDAEINPSVAIADNGSFSVFWQDSTQTNGNRFDRFGATELTSPLTIFGSMPGVAMDSDGSMLVTYNSGNEIWADKYSSGGSLTSSQSLSGPLSWVSDPTVSRASDGSYIVSWNGDGAGSDVSNVFVAQLASTGAVLAVSEILDTASQSSGSVAAYDVNHYAYAYTTRVLTEGDVEVGQVGTWGSPPTSTDTFRPTNEDISYIFAPSDFPFADADSDPFTQIRILTNATNGTLLLNGSVFLPTQVILIAQLAAGQLVFVPNANENGAAYSTFDFQVYDGTAYSVTQTFTINVDPVDDAPQILPPTTFNVAENQTAVGTMVASDPDSAILSYSIFGGVDSAKFAIDGSTGALRFVTARDFETPTGTGTNNIYDVIVQVSDGGLTHTQALTVTVTDVDEFDVGTVSDINLSANAVAENAVNGDVVGITAFASDADATTNVITYTLDNSAGGRFAINGSTGVVTVAGALDYETSTSHAVTVRATSADGSFSSQIFTINVTNVNDAGVAPVTDIDAAANTVAENSAVGTMVGVTANATDVDATDTVTYSLDDTAGGRFAINGSTGVVTVANGTRLDYEAATSHDIIVRATSSDSSFSTALFTINIDPVNDNSPTITSNDGGTTASINLAENSTAVTTVTANDTDLASQTLSYSIIGGADSAKFLIDSLTGGLSFVSPPDFESPDDFGANRTYEVIVGVSDGFGGSDSQLLNISVTPLNDNAPVFSSPATFNVDENTTTVGTVVATDADQAAQTVSFSIAGGADASKFTLVGNSLRFNFGRNFESPRDFDTDNVYEVDVRATDGFGGTTIQSVSAVVLNVNESPSSITPLDIFVDENTDTTSGTSVGFLTAIDPDLGDSHTFSIVGGDDRSKFTLGGVNGNELILTAGILDFESEDRYEVRIRVRDAGGRSTEREIRLHVRDLNEAPTAIEPDNFNVTENIDTTFGQYLGSLVATDQDGNESFTYAIVGGANASCFSLTGSDGDRLVLSAGVLNFENQILYEVIVRVTDSGGLSFDQAITVDVNDVNEAPSATGESITLLEGATHSALSGWLMLNDVDPESDDLTAVVVSGPQHGSLQLLSDGTFTYQHDGSETTTDRFQYAINDGNGHSATAWVDIAITPVNDLPDARRDTIVLSSFSPLVLDSAVLLANDIDAEGGLTISWVRSGLNGTVSLGTDGKIYYTPIPNSEGQDQFIYQIVDSNGAVDNAVVTIVTQAPIVEKPAPALPVADFQPKPTSDNSPPVAAAPSVIGTPAITPNASAQNELFARNPAADAESDGGTFESPSAETTKGVRSTHEFSRQLLLPQSVSSATNTFALSDTTRSAVTTAPYQLSAVQNLDKLIYSSPIWSELQGMTQDIVSVSKVGIGSIATVGCMSGVLSVGYAAWLVRGGMLLAGLASSMPAWQFFDPLSVLQISSGGAKGDEDDSLESLVADNNQSDEAQLEASHGNSTKPSQEHASVS